MSGNIGLDTFVLDTISIEPAPQKKGLILKHVEYLVKSEQFRSEVTRRYSDFQALNDLLLYRLYTLYTIDYTAIKHTNPFVRNVLNFNSFTKLQNP